MENHFKSTLSTFIALNNETGTTSGDPEWDGSCVTNKAKVTADVIEVVGTDETELWGTDSSSQ